MVRGRRHGLDHPAEPALGVPEGESGDDALGFFDQRDVCHVMQPFARIRVFNTSETEQQAESVTTVSRRHPRPLTVPPSTTNV